MSCFACFRISFILRLERGENYSSWNLFKIWNEAISQVPAEWKRMVFESQQNTQKGLMSHA